MKQKYFLIDVAKCHDCNNCFMACKDEHVDNAWLPYSDAQPRHGPRWMNIMRKERGQYPRIDMAYLPMPCQHCDDAPCQEKCPDLITRRGDGVVLINVEAARGKKELVDACPYGAIYWNEEANVGQKCTMCAHLLDNGVQEIPRCTHGCPTGAMGFVIQEPEEFEKFAKAEGYERYLDNIAPKGNVYYKNLYIYTKNFISGAIIKDGDCVEGAEVTLKGNGVECSMKTDYFGDFKFDALAPGEYTISVNGKEVKKLNIDESVNVDFINI